MKHSKDFQAAIDLAKTDLFDVNTELAPAHQIVGELQEYDTETHKYLPGSGTFESERDNFYDYPDETPENLHPY